jgi:hypothetical protein
MMSKGLSPEGSELNLAEVKIQHQNWLQHPETRMVIQALQRHTANHMSVTLANATSNQDANMVKQQAAIAYNLNLMVDIMMNPDLLFKLLNPETKQ